MDPPSSPKTSLRRINSPSEIPFFRASFWAALRRFDGSKIVVLCMCINKHMATYLQLFNYFSLPFFAHFAENPEI
jgi:hypothetical protein